MGSGLGLSSGVKGGKPRPMRSRVPPQPIERRRKRVLTKIVKGAVRLPFCTTTGVATQDAIYRLSIYRPVKSSNSFSRPLARESLGTRPNVPKPCFSPTSSIRIYDVVIHSAKVWSYAKQSHRLARAANAWSDRMRPLSPNVETRESSGRHRARRIKANGLPSPSTPRIAILKANWIHPQVAIHPSIHHPSSTSATMDFGISGCLGSLFDSTVNRGCHVH